MGLNHPRDLAAWHRWQAARAPLARRVRARLRTRPALRATLTTWGERPDVLVVLDSWSPTSRLALQRPLDHLDLTRIAVLSPGAGGSLPEGGCVAAVTAPVDLPFAPRVVVALGSYLCLGELGQAAAPEAAFVVVQHGLLTPLAPPLPERAHLLAWSQADADFWSEGRRDVSCEVVGSQLLFEAAATKPGAGDPATLLYLGQLHAAELPRRELAAAAREFCLRAGATYRPHPAERDRWSRAQHAVWARRGIRLDTAARPLASLAAPVVSVFSTGVLEAAARGVPAWVDFPRPPAWLEEFWERYGMRRWGSDPTPPPDLPTDSPAARVAEVIRRLA